MLQMQKEPHPLKPLKDSGWSPYPDMVKWKRRFFALLLLFVASGAWALRLWLSR